MIKKFYLIMLLTLIIFSGCSAQSKKIKQSTTNVGAVPDTLYPSANLIIPYWSAWTKTHYPEKIEEFKNNPLKFNEIVFLGNSLTEKGGDWGKRFNSPIIINRGISGDVTDGVLKRLGEICYFKPVSVFILIGINDLFNPSLSANYVGNNIIKIANIIHQRSPHTEIYIQTILPTTTKSLVTKINKTNDIFRYSKARSKIYKLIDLHPLFANDQDLMKEEYTVDGVHLNEKGYEVWVNKVKMYIK